MAAIQLTGVTGSDLRARAYFDANNVRDGELLMLTIEFFGEANLRDLHPPALAKAIGTRDWELDEGSAKAVLRDDVRRLTYRVKPKRRGVLWFPALEFAYAGTDGSSHAVMANEIPVHVKSGGPAVVVEGLDEDLDAMPPPPPLAAHLAFALTDDEAFAWKRALTKPTAEAFAAFDFPEARLNEASCAIRENDIERALRIYRRLEWRMGQTPEIEAGIVAALARRYGNPAVELPVWRQVLKPVLRFGWKGRVGTVFGGIAALTLLLWLLGRGIRAVACLALAVCLAGPADAQGLFRQMEEQMRQMQQQMQQAMGGMSFSFGTAEERERISVSATVSVDRDELQVGEPFSFVIALEYPRTASVGEIRIVPSEKFGLVFPGKVRNLTDGKCPNPTNVVKRLAVPARYDMPFRGKVAFSLEGMVSARQSRHGGLFTMAFSNAFRCETGAVDVDVRPPPGVGQPADFSGIVSEGLRLIEQCDALSPETNDVITITYRMKPVRGYVPPDFLPQGSAFGWTPKTDGEGRVVEVSYRRYFVADGAERTPKVSVSYYDPRQKAYRRAECGGTPLKYAIIP